MTLRHARQCADGPRCARDAGGSELRGSRLKEDIEGRKAVLEIIGYALDGNRDAMGLLEEVFARLRRTNQDFFDDPQEV